MSLRKCRAGEIAYGSGCGSFARNGAAQDEQPRGIQTMRVEINKFLKIDAPRRPLIVGVTFSHKMRAEIADIGQA